ncbi:helix-turn-helix domain-containing protein [Methylobacterium sp. J-067]|uniref:helix-turn-helix domain-containing protein n=1 Tax=Methylobacterium sp. J-067 TaxID=2836648 RepID=UPI001FB9901D|nr:helix-turn-helix domain-containing protein [Methylobacterium sp. J-067]MCJ2023848.1 helix-turn-helix domain-containing protein [Methylobacterium sp. J-067]
MNTYADAIRRQAEDAPRAALPVVTGAMWRAYAEGQITEAEAETLAALIEARRLSSAAHSGGQSPNPTGTPAARVADAPQDRQNSPRTGAGSRPRTDASLERRRRWAASGRLPPALAARFTLAEQAALALIAAETARRGDCRLSVPHLAALVGVAETTVRNAIREARKLGLLTVEERRLTGYRNDTNVVRIVSPEWVAWLRLARKAKPSRYSHGGGTSRMGGGCKSPNRMSTKIFKPRKTGTARPQREWIAAHGRAS